MRPTLSEMAQMLRDGKPIGELGPEAERLLRKVVDRKGEKSEYIEQWAVRVAKEVWELSA